MAREERFHEAPLEVERIRIGDRVAKHGQMPSDLAPGSAMTQIDEVRVCEQKLVAPVACQQNAGSSVPNRGQERMRAVPLRVEKWRFGMPDPFTAGVCDAARPVRHTPEFPSVLTIDLQQK